MLTEEVKRSWTVCDDIGLFLNISFMTDNLTLILIIDGKTMPHGKAINRYLARNLGEFSKMPEMYISLRL